MKRTWQIVINTFLLVLATPSLIFLIYLSLDRDDYVGLSKGLGFERLMNSAFFDYFMHPTTAIILIIVAVALIAKEFLISLQKRIIVNIILLIALVFTSYMVVDAINAPILNAPKPVEK